VSTDSRLALLERHLRAENARGMQDTLATLTPDCVLEDLALGRTYTGRCGAGDYYRIWWDAFAPTVTPERVHWTGDGEAIVEARWRGYHHGEFLAMQPTGREIDVPVAIFVTFGEDDLVAGERFYYDLATIRRQLAAG
jgi:SnoaL-like domain